MYNPFKPHIITNGEVFRIRRWRPFRWEYLDDRLLIWWIFEPHIKLHASIHSELAAQNRLNSLQWRKL